jgi:epidermal growth factor receptor substrate 15
MKNQLQSTSRSLATAKEERGTLEQTLAGQASQLSTLQTQLSSAKAAYETETTLLATLRDRHSTQLSEMQRTREELIRAESDLSAIRVEKSEIEGAFLRDKEEARDLHKRMVETSQQAEALKADVEKLKKEAKQQKGLLAIARKQLSTKESEKARAEKEHEVSLAEVASVTQEREQVEGEIANLDTLFSAQKADAFPSPSNSLMIAAAHPLPITPTPDLPSQGGKSNNPFERLAMTSGNSTPRSQSPFLGLSNTLISSPPLSTHEFVPANQADVPPQEATMPSDNSPVPDHDTDISYLAKETTSSNALEGIFSPATASGTDYFVTPPTSARHDSSSSPNPAERFPSLDDLSPPPVALQSTEKPTTPVPVAADLFPVHKVDLNTQLKEIEIEESDSDEESDENLTVGQSTNGKIRLAPPIPLPYTITDATQVAAPVDSFDDVFGSDEPHDKPLSNGNSKAVDLSPPLTDFIGTKLAVEQSPIAGVNEFDEALGKLPGSASPAIFSFDTTFDDNFDFASASNAVDFPSAPANERKGKSPRNAPDGLSGMPTTLSEPPVQPPFFNQLPMPVTTNDVPKFESSFEGASSGPDPTAATKSEGQPIMAPVPVQPQDDRSLSGLPSSPIQASPKVATTSSRVVETRPVSPPRAPSPSPRVVSPKPRMSSSSSKEIHEKVKETNVRHSKLSVSWPHFALSRRLNLSIDSPSIRQEKETSGTDAGTALTTSYSSSRTTLSYHHSC